MVGKSKADGVPKGVQKVAGLRIERKRLDDLLPAEYNPRVALKAGDEEYEKLRRSVETFGLVEPIIWNERTGTVVGGHQRLTVLRDLGVEDVDVSVVDLDEAHEQTLNVALNKISGDWDNEKLSALLSGLATDLQELTGFGEADIDALVGAKAAGDASSGGGLHHK